MEFEFIKTKNYTKLVGYLDSVEILIDVYCDKFPLGIYRNWTRGG